MIIYSSSVPISGEETVLLRTIFGDLRGWGDIPTSAQDFVGRIEEEQGEGPHACHIRHDVLDRSVEYITTSETGVMIFWGNCGIVKFEISMPEERLGGYWHSILSEWIRDLQLAEIDAVLCPPMICWAFDPDANCWMGTSRICEHEGMRWMTYCGVGPNLPSRESLMQYHRGRPHWTPAKNGVPDYIPAVDSEEFGWDSSYRLRRPATFWWEY